MYEVAAINYAIEQLARGPKGMEQWCLLESFLVHARCLNDFLWRDRTSQQPDDAFAADFCAPGVWNEARQDLSQKALEEIRHRKRFGREVMHLSYERPSGFGEHKQWACGRVFVEIASAMRRFSALAEPSLLNEPTRQRFQQLLDSAPDILPYEEVIAGGEEAT
jgi:hypothetical protein